MVPNFLGSNRLFYFARSLSYTSNLWLIAAHLLNLPMRPSIHDHNFRSAGVLRPHHPLWNWMTILEHSWMRIWHLLLLSHWWCSWQYQSKHLCAPLWWKGKMAGRKYMTDECIWKKKNSFRFLETASKCPFAFFFFFFFFNKSKGYGTISFHYLSSHLRETVLLCLFYRQSSWSLRKYLLKVKQSQSSQVRIQRWICLESTLKLLTTSFFLSH
jgi:hypothetical protein